MEAVNYYELKRKLLREKYVQKRRRGLYKRCVNHNWKAYHPYQYICTRCFRYKIYIKIQNNKLYPIYIDPDGLVYRGLCKYSNKFYTLKEEGLDE